MKKLICTVILVALCLLTFACSNASDPIIGQWTLSEGKIGEESFAAEEMVKNVAGMKDMINVEFAENGTFVFNAGNLSGTWSKNSDGTYIVKYEGGTEVGNFENMKTTFAMDGDRLKMAVEIYGDELALYFAKK